MFAKIFPSRDPVQDKIFFFEFRLPNYTEMIPNTHWPFLIFWVRSEIFCPNFAKSRPPGGKKYFFFDFSHAKYTEMIPNTHWSFLIFSAKFFLCTPGGTTGRELGTNRRNFFWGMVRCVSSSYVFWYPICPPSSKDLGVLTKWVNPSPPHLPLRLHLHSISLV